ncbi:MAG: helix-turn-helix domain-containing protein [Steroidobacteraceae bacterium]
MARKKPAAKPLPRRGPLVQRTELAASSRAFPRMAANAMPKTGWVRAIRESLGISQSQLAARAGVSRATVQQMERAEGRRRITLASLDRLADAMDCRVALAILPKVGTLEDVRRRQALLRAEALLNQKRKPDAPVRPRELEHRRERLAAKLLRGSSRKLWRQD